MFKGVIYIYGLPREIADIREVPVDLSDGAGMSEVVAALKEKIPALEGPVIRTGENRLRELYKFNINGTFYYDGQDFQLHKEDRIALLMPVTGG
jgi:molybdopterin converting factor small subunit